MRSSALALSSLSALALVACAPSGDDEDKGGGSPPFGYELAVAKQSVAGNSGNASARVTTLDVGQLRALLDADKAMLIDVRTPEEFAEGHIAGAINIPLDRFDPLHLPGSGERETILYCRSDRRSGLAATQYVEATGKPIRHLDGGILAWQEAGEPTQ